MSSVPGCVVFSSLTQPWGPLANSSYQPVIPRKRASLKTKPKHTVEVCRCVRLREVADEDEMKVWYLGLFFKVSVSRLLQTC